MSMLDSLKQLQREAEQSLAALTQSADLPEWYRTYLGRKGKLTDVLRGFGQLPAEERPAAGKAGNEVKQALESAFAARQDGIRETELQASLTSGQVDVTLPGRPVAPGHLHLTTHMLRRYRTIFTSMGFQVYESPEVETDENNFELLNIPQYHPARDMWDTFWLSDNVVLRTHTSPGQIRCMRERHPNPI